MTKHKEGMSLLLRTEIITPQKPAIWDKTTKFLVMCLQMGLFHLKRSDLKEPDKPSKTEAALTVLLLDSHAVTDGLVEAQRGRCGHRAQDGRQRRGFSLRDISLLLRIQVVPDQHRSHVRLQLQQSLQRELAQVFAEVIGHSLKFVFLFWFLLLTCGACVVVIVVVNFFISWKSDRQQWVWSSCGM